jgi:hypothetical protein
MTSQEKSIAWLQERTAEKKAGKDGNSELVEDFDDVGKLGQGFWLWTTCRRLISVKEHCVAAGAHGGEKGREVETASWLKISMMWGSWARGFWLWTTCRRLVSVKVII